MSIVTKESDALYKARQQMIEKQIQSRGINNTRILAAMLNVKRHEFVSTSLINSAYLDRPLSIGHNQTISQPYIVALMTELCRLQPKSRVLEIGTGCGYQTAVLAELCEKIYTIEFVPELAKHAQHRLRRLGYDNISYCTGNGLEGWPQTASFNAILAAAALPDWSMLSEALLNQLCPGGILVLPVGDKEQYLWCIQKKRRCLPKKKGATRTFCEYAGRGMQRGVGAELYNNAAKTYGHRMSVFFF